MQVRGHDCGFLCTDPKSHIIDGDRELREVTDRFLSRKKAADEIGAVPEKPIHDATTKKAEMK